MRRVYLDTNIFVYHLFTRFNKAESKTLTSRSKKLSDDRLKLIQEGTDYKGVTSILTIMETCTTGRKIMAENSNDSLQWIDSEVKKALQFFFSMKNLEIIPTNYHNISINDTLTDGRSYIFKYEGRRFTQNGKIKYKTLSSPDALHLSLAIRHECDEFWTADSDFGVLNEPITYINILK